jgi:hypothetical protein
LFFLQTLVCRAAVKCDRRRGSLAKAMLRGQPVRQALSTTFALPAADPARKRSKGATLPGTLGWHPSTVDKRFDLAGGLRRLHFAVDDNNARLPGANFHMQTGKPTAFRVCQRSNPSTHAVRPGWHPLAIDRFHPVNARLKPVF